MYAPAPQGATAIVPQGGKPVGNRQSASEAAGDWQLATIRGESRFRRRGNATRPFIRTLGESIPIATLTTTHPPIMLQHNHP